MSGVRAAGPLDTARLCELASAGAEDAATALSRMVDTTVHRRLPRSFELRADAPAECARPLTDFPPARLPSSDTTGVFFELSGDMQGVVAVLFSENGRDTLVGRMVERMGGPGLDTDLASAVNELSNILVSHMVSAIADRLSGRIVPSVPDLHVHSAGKELASRLLARAGGRPVRGLEAEIVDAAGLRLCSLVLAPGV